MAIGYHGIPVPPSHPRLRHQRRHGPVVVWPCPIPKRHVGIRPEVQAAVLGPFLQERERIFADFARRYCWYFVPIGRAKAELAGRGSLDRPTAFVDQVVVVGAQQRRVIQAGFAPV
jgi:hypothetical protein